ncbi:MAG: Fic family protein, partial [Fenollaria timonensis]
ILATILAAYRDFETRLDIFGDGLTALEQVKAAIDNFYTKFTKNDIMKIVPNLSKASIENSLKTLLEEGYIERHGKGRATYYTKE